MSRFYHSWDETGSNTGIVLANLSSNVRVSQVYSTNQPKKNQNGTAYTVSKINTTVCVTGRQSQWHNKQKASWIRKDECLLHSK